jgi:hypothetical protein
LSLFQNHIIFVCSSGQDYNGVFSRRSDKKRKGSSEESENGEFSFFFPLRISIAYIFYILFQDIEKDDNKGGEDDSEKKKLPDVAEKKRGRPKKVCVSCHDSNKHYSDIHHTLTYYLHSYCM